MKNKTVKTLMVVAMLFTLSLYFIGGTYARYTGDYTGSGEVNVAEWAVKLDGQQASQKEMDLTFTPKENTDVVKDKIAPGSTAEAEVTIDLEGTEVAVEVMVEAKEDLQAALQPLGLNADEITFTSTLEISGSAGVSKTGTGEKDSPYVITLPTTGAFQSDDKLHMTLTLEWTNNDKNDTVDTAAGEKEEGQRTITVPVTVTVQQHIGE